MLRHILNKYFLGFVTLAVLALILIYYTGQTRTAITPVEKAVRYVTAPLQSGVTLVVNGVSETVSSVFNIGRIKEENKQLQSRVAELQSENLLLKEYEYQNLRLRDLLQFKDSVSRSYTTIAASVIGRNPSNEYKTITINRGENNGVRKNMAVVTSTGLAGHVINVSGNSAEVLLIIDNSDSSSAVGGLVQITRTPGVIEGLGDAGYLKMSHVAKDAPVREKQVVITSGMGGVYPKGLPVGRITKVDVESNGLEKYAIVRPYVDFNRLEEVMVIKSVAGEGMLPSVLGGE